ncbi:MAG TPA: hypothetical protein VN428_16940, partial [Bryobacteraceae bacterium]|nr:hypothetical protein [Bryobacteraceae bacterium]
VGVDLGQRQDYTAITVLDRSVYNIGRDPVWLGMKTETLYAIRFLRRLPLGTPYTEVVETVGALVDQLNSRQPLSPPTVVADATGVGAPVMEMFRNMRMPGELKPVLITGGEKAVFDGVWKVPKRDLIAGVQLMLEHGELTMAKNMEYAAELAKEMVSMRVRVTGSMNELYTPWRERDHDDLVLAVALACWWAKRPAYSLFGSERLF